VKTFLFFGLAVLARASLLAQTPSGDAVDRSQLFRTQPGVTGATPEETPLGYAEPSANDRDLGVQSILKEKEVYKAWTFTLDAPFYYTSNVALTRNGEVSDGVFAPLVAVTFQPHIWQTLYGEFAVAQQFFYCDTYDDFNFFSFDAIAGLVYYLPQFHNLTLRFRYDYNRLTSDDWDEFFSNHQLIFIAELPYRFGRAMQLSVGAAADLSVAADPQGPRRHEFDFYAGYQVAFARSFTVDASARLQVKDYIEGDRTDVGEILAVTANYHVRDWLVLSAISTFAWNQSNQSVFDYQVANAGGGISATIKF
jgi:hypothetical protein